VRAAHGNWPARISSIVGPLSMGQRGFAAQHSEQDASVCYRLPRLVDTVWSAEHVGRATQERMQVAAGERARSISEDDLWNQVDTGLPLCCAKVRNRHERRGHWRARAGVPGAKGDRRRRLSAVVVDGGRGAGRRTGRSWRCEVQDRLCTLC
jgi:hypothetical protein